MNFEIGELYAVKFRDHCIGDTESCLFTVVGFCVKEDKNDLVLNKWHLISGDYEDYMANMETSVIVKSAIVDVQRLRIKKSLL